MTRTRFAFLQMNGILAIQIMDSKSQSANITPSLTTKRHRIDLMIALLLIVALGCYSAMFPVVSYDSWAYHFPFSTYLFNIGGGKGAYQLCQAIADRYQGFPLFSEIVQGLIWKMTGSVRSVVIPQLIALGYLVYLAQKRLRVSPLLLLASFCAVPLLLIHTFSTNNDLISGLLIAAGMIIVVDIVSVRQDIDARTWILLIALFSAGSATKYQSTLVVSIVLVALLFVLLLTRRFKSKYLIWFLIAGISIGVFEIKNLVVHHNPFYPIQIKVGQKILFEGPESEYSQKPSYKPDIGASYFLASASEFDWVKRGVVPRYSYAMEEGDRFWRFGAARSGGFGQAYMLATFTLLILQFIMWRRIDRKQKALISTAAFLLLATAVMPQSLELRYWLYLPVFLNIVSLRYICKNMSNLSAALVVSPLIVLGALGSFEGIWNGKYIYQEKRSDFSAQNIMPVELNYSD